MNEFTDGDAGKPDPERGGEGASHRAWPTAGVGSRPAQITRREGAPKRALASLGFLIDATRRRRSGRMILWSLVLSLALGGVGLLAYPFATQIWADRIQGNLDKKFAAISPAEGLAAFRSKRISEGAALTRLSIPKIGLKGLVVVEGTTGNALRAGAGHYPDSALPGDVSGNVAIAGHRTGFGEPFLHLDRLRQGDRIELKTPFGRFIYEVIGPFDGHGNPWITGPLDWTVVTATPEPSLTLTTCDPPHTSKNRLIVRARLVSSG